MVGEKQVIKLQMKKHLAESLSYSSLYKSCLSWKLDAWRQLKLLANEGDIIAKMFDGSSEMV
jgi:hypothetical protein